MSTVRYFDQVPHIVRYGMQSSHKGKSWTLFYRNAVRFTVHVSQEDIANTPFAQIWRDHVDKGDPPAPVGSRPNWVAHWDEFCDCIISQCMPLLQELAPASRRWSTLHDYLHTPAYDLKLVADEATRDVVARITSGPQIEPSYEYRPTPASDFKELPIDRVRCYQAGDLVVLDQEKDWRRPPNKVRTSGGEVFYFEPCTKISNNAGTGLVSSDTINAYARLYAASKSDESDKNLVSVQIPTLQGIVLTEPSVEVESSSAAGATVEGSQKDSGTEHLVAGILLNYLAHAKSFADISPTEADKRKWKQQIAEAVKYLHAHNVTVGGRSGSAADGSDSWYYINQYTVYIAPGIGGEGENAWLKLNAACAFRDAHDSEQDTAEEVEREKEKDWKGVEKTFD